MGLTAMRFGHGLNGPLSIVNGWSWSGYEQNENEQNETKTATSGRAASASSGDGQLHQGADAEPPSRPESCDSRSKAPRGP